MLKRSICIFPSFENIKEIESIRAKYDPLYKLIPPHITLVFPFESDISKEKLLQHIRNVLINETPFKITLQGITGADERYLFLGVKSGNDEIIKLHDKLYTGLLKKHHYRNISYIPHITVGQLETKNEFNKVVEDTINYNSVFNAEVSQIIVELIDNGDRSSVEFYYNL
ncbi:2'-5' RNA ligase family protein [Guptibacillus hwajinpoensis]|uniref:2'-5' RNA ligase family protein n=1 Tax=Guptibacillus hwajinpoensis TaxID=208199 RepID=UPI001CFC7184|nr:2'-5' RNA ligase family protein [Pseudalkalibacillus hwajinpoensis]WLR58849.1 2'-5' RNA ligase family protein [Pseudalkalibacillus hwajinpoensis]